MPTVHPQRFQPHREPQLLSGKKAHLCDVAPNEPIALRPLPYLRLQRLPLRNASANVRPPLSLLLRGDAAVAVAGFNLHYDKHAIGHVPR